MNYEEKWKAVINCDSDYNGLFYYAVKTTGVFCRPSCKAKAPLEKNVLFFDNVDKALAAGFRPCKMCRPDVTETEYDPNRELIKRVKKLLENSFKEPLSPSKIAAQFGFSNNHFTRIFKHYSGMTINEYITKLRIIEAMKLLETTDKDIITIAYEVGFKSISNFYQCFKKRAGASPQKYRNSKVLYK